MPDQARSRFLELPPELRDLIYKRAFDGRTSIDNTYHTPGILLACKKTHRESIELFYETATFQFHRLEICRRWLTPMLPKYRGLLARLYYQINHDDSDVNQNSRKHIPRDEFRHMTADQVGYQLTWSERLALPLTQRIVLRVKMSDDDFEDIQILRAY